jgi:hypothetical protein
MHFQYPVLLVGFFRHSCVGPDTRPEFSTTMMAIREWLDANRYKPTRYTYDHDKDAVLVTVDFPAGVAAKAFAMRFDGVDRFPLEPASPDSRRQSPI